VLPEYSSLTFFIAASMALLIVPGPAVLYIVTRSLDQGRLAGIVSTLGIATGTLVHVGAAAIGVSAILASSALAFGIVKYAGAIYLIYLGLRKLFFEEKQDFQNTSSERLSRIYSQGVVVNLLNPKTALFFLAFLPQFADPSRGPIATQVLTLGLLFVVLSLLSDSLYALLAATFGRWLKQTSHFTKFQRLFSGGVYITLGIFTALSGANKKRERAGGLQTQNHPLAQFFQLSIKYQSIIIQIFMSKALHSLVARSSRYFCMKRTTALL